MCKYKQIVSLNFKFINMWIFFKKVFSDVHESDVSDSDGAEALSPLLPPKEANEIAELFNDLRHSRNDDEKSEGMVIVKISYIFHCFICYLL